MCRILASGLRILVCVTVVLCAVTVNAPTFHPWPLPFTPVPCKSITTPQTRIYAYMYLSLEIHSIIIACVSDRVVGYSLMPHLSLLIQNVVHIRPCEVDVK